MVIRRTTTPGLWAVAILLALPLIAYGLWYLALQRRMGVPQPPPPMQFAAEWRPSGPQLHPEALVTELAMDSDSLEWPIVVGGDSGTFFIEPPHALWYPDPTPADSTLRAIQLPLEVLHQSVEAVTLGDRCYVAMQSEGESPRVVELRPTDPAGPQVVPLFTVEPEAGRVVSHLTDLDLLPSGDLALLAATSLGRNHTEYAIRCYTAGPEGWSLRWPPAHWIELPGPGGSPGRWLTPRLRCSADSIDMVSHNFYTGVLLSVDAATGQPTTPGPETPGLPETPMPTYREGYQYQNVALHADDDARFLLSVTRRSPYLQNDHRVTETLARRLDRRERVLRLAAWQRLAPERGFSWSKWDIERLELKLYTSPTAEPVTLPEEVVLPLRLQAEDDRRASQLKLLPLDDTRMLLVENIIPHCLADPSWLPEPGQLGRLGILATATGEVSWLGWFLWSDSATPHGAQLRWSEPLLALTPQSLVVTGVCQRADGRHRHWVQTMRFDRAALGL